MATKNFIFDNTEEREKLENRFDYYYNWLYENDTRHELITPLALSFDEKYSKYEFYKNAVNGFAFFRGDVLSSDRECAAFMLLDATEDIKIFCRE